MRATVTFLFFCFFYTSLQATHNRAGEILYEQTAPLTIQATIITYTQTSSIPADRDSLMICWGDGTCEMLLRSNGNGEPIENDYKVNSYIGVHKYADLGNYTLSMTDPNRNGSILNVNPPNSDQVEFHLQTNFTLRDLLLDGGSNQSPTLLFAPIDVGFVRQPFMHTPNAIDLDGDSVAYELVTPLRGNDAIVPNYMSLDQIGAGAANSYTFDEVTGLLIWDSPQIVGQYNVAIKIKAYRNGVLTEEIIRDMQILIKPDENIPPVITTMPEQNELITIKAGKTLEFEFAIFDSEDAASSTRPLYRVAGESVPNNTEITENPFIATLSGTFKWTPSLTDIRSMPYQIVFKATDSQGFASFKVLRIQVIETSTNIPLTFQQLGFKLFPNPATSQIQLQLPEDQVNQVATISIFDNLGRMIQENKIDNTSSILPLNIANFQSGHHLLKFQTATTTVSTLLLVK